MNLNTNGSETDPIAEKLAEISSFSKQIEDVSVKLSSSTSNGSEFLLFKDIISKLVEASEKVYSLSGHKIEIQTRQAVANYFEVICNDNRVELKLQPSHTNVGFHGELNRSELTIRYFPGRTLDGSPIESTSPEQVNAFLFSVNDNLDYRWSDIRKHKIVENTEITQSIILWLLDKHNDVLKLDLDSLFTVMVGDIFI